MMMDHIHVSVIYIITRKHFFGIHFAFQFVEIPKRPGEYGIQRNCIKEV